MTRSTQSGYAELIARHLRDRGLRRELERLNDLDMALYERVLELRARRRRRMARHPEQRPAPVFFRRLGGLRNRLRRSA